jgi:hypothetical protein
MDEQKPKFDERDTLRIYSHEELEELGFALYGFDGSVARYKLEGHEEFTYLFCGHHGGLVFAEKKPATARVEIRNVHHAL